MSDHAATRRTRSPLLRPSLLGVICAETVSSFGTQMTFVALPWFVLATTGSPSRMGAVLAAELLPIAVLGIPSGTVVGRLGAIRTMLVADLVRAPLIASIPLLHASGHLSFPLLLVIVALMGVFIAPYFAAQRLVLPELVGEDEHTVAQANAVVEGAQRAVSLIGPASAGLLIAGIGATNVLYIDAGTFLFAFVVLRLFVPRRRPAAATAESAGLLAGLRFLLRDPLLRVLGFSAMVANGLGQMLGAGLLVLAFEEFGGSSRVAGVLFAAFGAGALVGTVAAVRLMPRFDPVRLAAGAFAALSLPLFALAFPLPVAGVVGALALSSFFGPLVNAPLISVITVRTPKALRAKVMTAVLTTAMLAGPVGMIVAGPLLESLGPRPVFAIIASGQLLATLPFVAFAFRTPAAAEPSTAA